MNSPFQCGPNPCEWICRPPLIADCLIFSDYFDRTEIGTDWTTVGSWSIASNELVVLGTGEATCNTPFPGTELNYYVEVDITFQNVDGNAYIKLGDDLYIFMWYKKSGSCSVIEIQKPLGTVLESLKAVSAGPTFKLRAGYTEEREIAWGELLDSSGSTVINCIRHNALSQHTGLFVSIGSTDSTNSVAFDNFRFEYAKFIYAPDCPEECVVTSDDDCQFTQASLDGTYNPLVSDDILCRWEIASGTWTGSGPAPDQFQTSSANALIISHELEEGVPVFGYHRGSMIIRFTNNGDTARVYVNYDSVTDNFCYEITYRDIGAGPQYLVKLYQDGVLLSDPGGWHPQPSVAYPLALCIASDDIDCLTMKPLTGQPSRAYQVVKRKGHRRIAFGTGPTVAGTVTFQTPNGASVIDKINGTDCFFLDPGSACLHSPGGGGAVKSFAIDISNLTGNSHLSGCDMSVLNGTYKVADDADFGYNQCGYQIQGFEYCTGWYFGGNTAIQDALTHTFGYGVAGYFFTLYLFENNLSTLNYTYTWRSPLVPKTAFSDPATWLRFYDNSTWELMEYTFNGTPTTPPGGPLESADYRVRAFPTSPPA